MKVKVPEAMLEAACENWTPGTMSIEKRCKSVLEAALGWLDGELAKMLEPRPTNDCDTAYNTALRDVRRMFAAPDEDEAIADLLVRKGYYPVNDADAFNNTVREAHRRGLAQREGKVRG